MNLKIPQHPLTYARRLDARQIDDITLVVIHCTELPDLPMARVWGEKVHHADSQTGNSGHFYIDRDGGIEQWVPLSRIAHHVRGFNTQSIGIELVNTGRYPDWFHSGNQKMTEPYPDVQIDALVKLLNHLSDRFPNLQDICGHEDLDTGTLPSEDAADRMIRRKLDPGALFPWPELLDKISLQRLTTGK